MKLQISLNDDLLVRADKYAEENYLSRSGLISQALTQYLNQNEFIGAVKELSVNVKKIADTGVCDDETRQQLEDFERVVNVLSGKR